MTKLFTYSQELVLRQIDGEHLNSSLAQSFLASSAGATAATAGEILTPEIRDRSAEWMTSLEGVSTFSLPRYLYGSPVIRAHRKTVRYMADHFDRAWLEERRHLFGTEKKLSTAPCSSPPQDEEDAMLLLFEKLITRLEVAAHYRSDLLLESIPADTQGLDVSPALTGHIRAYWLRKRYALGGRVPCLAALRLCVKEENQSMLCRDDVLGDCPLPFKRRDLMTSVVLRAPPQQEGELEGEKVGRKRGRCDALLTMCEGALRLTTKVFQREQLSVEHTYASLYEMAYMRHVLVHPRGAAASPSAVLDDMAPVSPTAPLSLPFTAPRRP